MTRSTRHIATSLGIVLITLGCSVSNLRSDEGAKLHHVKGHFLIGKKQIRLEKISSKVEGDRQRPAILIVHGIDGMCHPEKYYEGARMLAERGNIVYLVRYFDITGDQTLSRDFVLKNRKLFLKWKVAIKCALRHIEQNKCVDSERMGILGVSLGSFLTMSLIAEDGVQVQAVANWFGGIPEETNVLAKQFPPTLIIHGDSDFMVPVKHAFELKKVLQKRNAPLTWIVYPGENHLFWTRPTGKNAVAATNSTVEFFQTHLHRQDHVAAPSNMTDSLFSSIGRKFNRSPENLR